MSDSTKHSSHPHHAHTQKSHPPHKATVPMPQKPAPKRGTGFWLAVTCYLVSFCCAGSLVHSLVFWILVLGIIPALTGLLTGRLQQTVNSRQGFIAGLRAAAWPMFFFSAASMMLVHSRVDSSASPSGTFFVALFAALVYALLAGLVSGLVSAVVSRQTAQSGGTV